MKVSPMTKTYAIGDVHGCLEQLQQLVETCEKDSESQKSTFILLGDYIDRGPNSRGVIEFLLGLQKCSPDQIICLKGNHEDLFLAALDGEDAEMHWLSNGGDTTLLSYGATRARDLPSSHIDWIRSLPLFHDAGRRFFVHAGVNPDRSLDRQRSRDFLWIRKPFLSSEKDFGRLIVHGHTPVQSGVPDRHFNRLNIDTGAVYGQSLTAAVFDKDITDPCYFLRATPAT